MEEGVSKSFLYDEMKRINDIPFDSKRKMMTTIHKYGNGYRIITKGAPDVLLRDVAIVIPVVKSCQSLVKKTI